MNWVNIDLRAALEEERSMVGWLGGWGGAADRLSCPFLYQRTQRTQAVIRPTMGVDPFSTHGRGVVVMRDSGRVGEWENGRVGDEGVEVEEEKGQRESEHTRK